MSLTKFAYTTVFERRLVIFFITLDFLLFFCYS